jgi:hypothetical protein
MAGRIDEKIVVCEFYRYPFGCDATNRVHRVVVNIWIFWPLDRDIDGVHVTHG